MLCNDYVTMLSPAHMMSTSQSLSLKRSAQTCMQVSLGVDEIFVPIENMKNLGWKKIGLYIFPISFRSFSPTFFLNQNYLPSRN